MTKKKTERVKTGDWMYGIKEQKEPGDYDLVTVIDGPKDGKYRVVNWDSSKVHEVKSEYLRMTADEKERLIKEAEAARDRERQAEYDARCKRLYELRAKLHEVLPKRYSASSECDIEENDRTWQDRVYVPIDVLEMFLGIQPGMKRKLK